VGIRVLVASLMSLDSVYTVTRCLHYYSHSSAQRHLSVLSPPQFYALSPV